MVLMGEMQHQGKNNVKYVNKPKKADAIKGKVSFLAGVGDKLDQLIKNLQEKICSVG